MSVIPNCRGMDTDEFYEQANWTKLKKVCKGCPILVQRKEMGLKKEAPLDEEDW